MSVYVGDQKAHIFHGDHHPAELWGPHDVKTTGKNLCPSSNYNTLMPCVLNAGVEYAVSVSPKSTDQLALAAQNSENDSVDVYPLKTDYFSSFIPVRNTKFIRWVWGVGQNQKVINGQIELGSVPTPYEPYTGGKPGIYHELVRYAGFDKAKVSGIGLAEIGEQPYKAALPSCVVHGAGHQDSYAEVAEQTGGIVTMQDMSAGRPLKVVADILPQQEGSGDPSPMNVRNFKEITSAEVTVCGENLLNHLLFADGQSAHGVNIQNNKDGSFTATGTNDGIGVTNLVTSQVLGTGNYIFAKDLQFFFQVAVIHKSDGLAYYTSVNEETHFTVKTGEYAELVIQASRGYSGTNTIKPMLSLVPTPYRPYSGTTSTATFDPIYGGRVDWNKRKVAPTRKIYQLDGSESWGESGSEDPQRLRFWCFSIYSKKSESNAVVPSALCNTEKTITANDGYIGRNYGLMVSTVGEIGFSPAEIYTLESWKAHLKQLYDAGTPVTVCTEEELPTIPATISTPPATISGTNNIYSSTGPVTASAPAGPSPEFRVEPTWAEGVSIGLRGGNLYDGKTFVLNHGVDGCWIAPPNIETITVVADIRLPPDGHDLYCKLAAIPEQETYDYTSWNDLYDKTGIGDIAWIVQPGHSGTVQHTMHMPKGYRLWILRQNGDAPFIQISAYVGDIPGANVTPYIDLGTTQPIPILRAIGDIADTVDFVSGTVTRRIFSGSLSNIPVGVDNGWIPWEFRGHYGWYLNFLGKGFPANIGYACIGMGNYFPIITRYTIENNQSYLGQENYNFLCDDLKDEKVFTEWLKTHDLQIAYPVADPIIEHIDPAILRQHPGYNQVIQLGGTMPVVIDAEYYREI